MDTGEEYVELHSQRATPFRWRDKEWEVTGRGGAKLLLHRRLRSVRCRLRQEKALKIVEDLMVVVDAESVYQPKPTAGSELCGAWCAFDWSEGEPQFEKLALKCVSIELAMNFKEVFELVHELRIGPSTLTS